MCKIEEVTGYRLNGRLFDTPLAALAAGLGEIANDIQRNHVNNVLQGLLKHNAALVYLLPLYAQEVAPTVAAEKDPPAGEASADINFDEPFPIAPTKQTTVEKRRRELTERIQAWAKQDDGFFRQDAIRFLKAYGWIDMADLAKNAMPGPVEDMHRALDEQGVA